MTILELYIFFLPLINILGTICLITLAAAGVLYMMLWIIWKIWRFVLMAGALSALIFVLGLFLACP